MVCRCWLFMALMGLMCSSGSGSMCLESAACSDMRDKDKIQDCLHLCTSTVRPDIKPPSGADQQEYDGLDDPDGDDDNSDLLLSILLSTLASEGKTPEEDVNGHNDQRRSYAMEHFRWGKPFGRKRKPVKLFPSALDDEAFPLRARRHLSWNRAEAKGGAAKGNPQDQELLRSRSRSRSRAPPGLPERKAETYRMSHFRWGSPPASKQNKGFVKQWEEKPRGKLAKLLKNILAKDVKMIMG